jgi:hypothetical protein
MFSRLNLCSAEHSSSGTRSRNDARQMDEKELTNLQRLQHCSVPKLLGFHQSYPSAPVHGLHSLSDYFREISPPSSVEDTLKFWGSTLCLIDALYECSNEK